MMDDLFGSQETEAKLARRIECLGMTFTNDEKRRKHFLDKLREKLKDPDFRKIDGFPIGSDEDILALSDPPYYTACPNPFIADFIKHYGKLYDPSKPYSREPFAADTSAGKFDPVYRSHSYHTKVPYIAIQEYLKHYAEGEGSFCVLDGFSGSGMTGIAARKLPKSKTSLNVVLADLSPEATFISSRMMSPTDSDVAIQEHKRILMALGEKTAHLYDVPDGHTNGRVNYTVWSDVFLCPECSAELVFWDIAVVHESGEMRDSQSCTQCGAKLSKRSLTPSFETYFDDILGQSARRVKEIPVLINYTTGSGRRVRAPKAEDFKVLKRSSMTPVPFPVPIDRMPEGDEARRNDPTGLTNVHHFYTRRMLIGLSIIWHEVRESRAFHDMAFVLSRMLPRASRLHKWKKGQTTGITTGTLYVPSLRYEYNVNKMWEESISYAQAIIGEKNVVPFAISTQSASSLDCIPSNSIDYIFTDPPFGGNLNYSDLNFIWESWLRVWTNNTVEAVVSRIQGKGLSEYSDLMSNCLKQYYRVLKPSRWLTMVFHNSHNSVWAAIQEALFSSGFIIADVRTLDKKQKSFKQIQGAGTVKQDLIISAYKPNGGLEDRFKLEAGREDGVWDFVRTHLKQLPVFVSKDGQAEVVAERQNYLLFDRMIAFHVQRGVAVPLSAAEFYAGLEQRFPPRDGMYFLPEQVAEYDKKRMTVREVLQLQLFVIDESSAIQWLKQQLTKKPQTFQELHPQFLKEIGGWQKHEKPLELSELLEQNFLRYDGKGEVLNQIHSYLSSNFKELRNLPKDDESLRAKGKDRWYVSDPNKAGDLEKLRERSLLKEFEEYRASSQKRLKVFRLEAVRAGFKKAWQDKSENGYRIIIEVAKKIPENVLQEDPKLLMWYDQAMTRTGE